MALWRGAGVNNAWKQKKTRSQKMLARSVAHAVPTGGSPQRPVYYPDDLTGRFVRRVDFCLTDRVQIRLVHQLAQTQASVPVATKADYLRLPAKRVVFP